jgi:rRNA maturation protein Nop10
MDVDPSPSSGPAPASPIPPRYSPTDPTHAEGQPRHDG